MDHNEAIQQMAAERYLLGELTPELRDAFEEHAFDCPECAVDLRAGAAFINAAKVELPEIAAASAALRSRNDATNEKENRLAIVAAAGLRGSRLRRVAGACRLPEPGYNPIAPQGSERTEHTAIRIFSCRYAWGAHTSVEADRTKGAALSIELPQDSGYASFAFDLYDPQGKQLWTRT